jgi:hypothetical protein
VRGEGRSTKNFSEMRAHARVWSESIGKFTD